MLFRSRTFSAHIMVNLFPRSEILITLHILSQDGSVLSSLVNAATLALVDAGIPLTSYVVACSAGMSAPLTDDESPSALIDLNALEEGDLPNLTIACAGSQEKIALFHMESRVGLSSIETMMATAISGCNQLRIEKDETIRAHGKDIAALRLNS